MTNSIQRISGSADIETPSTTIGKTMSAQSIDIVVARKLDNREGQARSLTDV